jgi:hypothetical protein
VLITPTLIGVFLNWGINSAMVRCTAQYLSEGRAFEVRSILVSGVIFEAILGDLKLTLLIKNRKRVFSQHFL